MFTVVFVCTGNRCRSPLAEVSFRAACSSEWVEVHSAGTLQYEGIAPPPEMIRAATMLDLDISEKISRHLPNVATDETDLVLGMSLEHAATASVDYGVHPSRTFTLLEFVRLSSGEARSEEDARRIVAEAHNRRASTLAFSPRDEISDPMGGPKSVYLEAAQIIDDACKELARRLCGHR